MAELSAQGGIAQPQATSVATTDALIATGSRARDISGNEYMYVSFSETLTAGQWVCIAAGVASRLATASRGPVGIVQASVTSAENGWVMIYGVYDTAQIAQTTGTSEATSVYVLGAPAGATTEAAAEVSSLSSLATNRIFGAWPRAAASTATTLSSSAHSGITIQVQLNYPFVLGETVNTDTTVGSSA